MVQEVYNHRFNINLSYFNGPMDLLLHLVEQQDLPIEKVEMAAICEQYLEVINKSEMLDLEQAGEYLVIAATLTAIKSAKILPAGSFGEADKLDFDGMRSEEFYEQLRLRLKEYELTKARAKMLRASPQHGIHTFSRADKEFVKNQPFEVEKSNGLELGKLFLASLKRVGTLTNRFRVFRDSVSIVGYMVKILDVFKGIREVPRSFLGLVYAVSAFDKNNQFSKSKARNSIVGSFIALLELMKRGVVKADQEFDGEIEIKLEMIDEQIKSQGILNQSLKSEFDEYENSSVEDRERIAKG